MTYVERLRELETRCVPTQYVTNDEYRRQKAALTRAQKSSDYTRVLRTVEKTLGEWSGKAWPDDWSRWRNALEYTAWSARKVEQYDLADELDAAVLILFP